VSVSEATVVSVPIDPCRDERGRSDLATEEQFCKWRIPDATDQMLAITAVQVPRAGTARASKRSILHPSATNLENHHSSCLVVFCPSSTCSNVQTVQLLVGTKAYLNPAKSSISLTVLCPPECQSLYPCHKTVMHGVMRWGKKSRQQIDGPESKRACVVYWW
jgi:hypothetical protein